MRVHIDPARRDEEAVGIDDPLGRPGLAANRDDALAIDRDIAGEARRGGAVNNPAAANDDVVHRGSPSQTRSVA
jgi:hypothetical protein